uniref:GNAT family N-acetyltransferase n=1 Tax=Enterocloster clostridioformis TaxID=1531 RepID=UPI003FA4C3DA
MVSNRLFYGTIHSVNRKDYTEEQLNAWADGDVDMEAWYRSFMEHETVVAVDGENIIGFGDMDENGYLDRLYVHRDYQGQGAYCRCPHASIRRLPVLSPRIHHSPSLFWEKGIQDQRYRPCVAFSLRRQSVRRFLYGCSHIQNTVCRSLLLILPYNSLRQD